MKPSLGWMRLCAILLCVALCGAWAMAQSQATTGAFEGVVTDDSGAVVPNAKVTFRNIATGFERTTQSNGAGLYSLQLMPVGEYEVRVELSGFATNLTKSIHLGLGQTLTLHSVMKVAGVAQTVEVNTKTPLVEPSRTGITTGVDPQSVMSLPLNGRRFSDLALLTPSVMVEPERNQLSFAGQRGINSNINIDGADFNEPFFGGQRGGERTSSAYMVSQEAVREFQVARAGFAAEFGRSTGGVLNVITKSGANDLHGSGFYFLRHKEFGPRDYFGQNRLSTRQQFGASLGGAIVKDKLFFYGVYDGQREVQPLIVSFALPSPSIVTTPAAQAEVQRLAAGMGSFVSTNTVDTALAKVDWNINSKNNASFRYNHSRNYADNGTFTGVGRGLVEENGIEQDGVRNVVGSLNTIITNSMINELRAQYSYETRPRDAKSEGPQVSVGANENGPYYGGVSYLPTHMFDTMRQFADNVSYTKGRHQLKAGLDFSANHVDQFFRGNWRGVYIFNTWSGYLDTINQVNGAAADQFRIFFGPGTFAATQFLTAYFVQDTIKLNRRVTLNLGFRHEIEQNPSPGDKIYNPDIPASKTIPNDFRQFDPRAGIAWDVTGNGKTVVRVSGGIFNAPTPMLMFAQAYTANGNPNVGLAFTFSKAQILDIQKKQPQFVFPFVPDTMEASGSSYFTGLGLAGSRPDVSVFDAGFRNPRTYNWNAGFDHQLTDTVAVSVEYVHSKGVYLERIRDINLRPPVVGADVNGETRPLFGTVANGKLTAFSKINPKYGIIRNTSASAKSRFDALTVQATKRYSKKLSFLTSYTLSYNKDDDSNERNYSGIVYENAYDFQNEYGWSRLDQRHRLVGSASYDLPWGFQVSGLGTLVSGRPWTAFVGSDVNGDGQNTDRPVIGGVATRRNTYRQRNSFVPDMRISKTFRLTERHRVALVADMFNFLNRQQFMYRLTDNEQGGATAQTWGARQTPLPKFNTLHDSTGALLPSSIVSVNTPYQLQLSVKYTF